MEHCFKCSIEFPSVFKSKKFTRNNEFNQFLGLTLQKIDVTYFTLDLRDESK